MCRNYLKVMSTINGWMSIIILLLQWQIRFCSIDTESKMSILQKPNQKIEAPYNHICGLGASVECERA